MNTSEKIRTRVARLNEGLPMTAVSRSRPGAATKLSTIRTTMDRNDHALSDVRGAMSPAVRDAMLAAVPGLRAFAISLSGNIDRADDLLQEALLHAIAGIGSFQPGTNMSAWLIAILRNLFYTDYRKRRREVEDADGRYINSLKSAPEQRSRVEFEEFREALAMLPTSQREALLLVGASGFSCDEAAAICKCAAGTIKSRVHRARTRLSKLLSIDNIDQFGQDPTTRGVLTVGRHG